MSKYFIKLPKEEQKGPLTIDELKQMNLNDDYLIWKEGFSNWNKIDTVKELDGFILKLPPKDNPTANQIKERDSYFTNMSWIVLLSLAVLLFILLGGLSDKYDLLENWSGLADSSYGDEAALKVRLSLGILALAFSGIIALLLYYYNMLNIYKKVYQNG